MTEEKMNGRPAYENPADDTSSGDPGQGITGDNSSYTANEDKRLLAPAGPTLATASDPSLKPLSVRVYRDRKSKSKTPDQGTRDLKDVCAAVEHVLLAEHLVYPINLETQVRAELERMKVEKRIELLNRVDAFITEWYQRVPKTTPTGERPYTKVAAFNPELRKWLKEKGYPDMDYKEIADAMASLGHKVTTIKDQRTRKAEGLNYQSVQAYDYIRHK